MSRIFVVGAPSGTGKTTLLKLLLGRVPGIRFSVSHSTRPARPGEVNGHDYHFVARHEFEASRARGEFLEWAEVYGNLYGTHRDEFARAEKEGTDLVLDVDVQGARSIRAASPGAVLVLVLPPSWETLEERLRTRGTESEETIARRLALARDQLEGYETYDYAVINDDRDEALQALEAIFRAERLRVGAQKEAIGHLLETARVTSRVTSRRG